MRLDKINLHNLYRDRVLIALFRLPPPPLTFRITIIMAPKGGNAKKESGRAKKAENEAKKQEAASIAKVGGLNAIHDVSSYTDHVGTL